MKISLLLAREPFKQVFCATLARYLWTTTGRAHRVSWQPGPAPWALLARRPAGLWLVHPELNAVVSARARPEVFANPWREFGRGATPLKTALQRTYLALHSAPGLGGAFASHHLRIEPELDGAESILILGGNTRLRLLDLQRGEVVSILKQGFADAAFKRELDLRQTGALPLAPPIVQIRDLGRAFVEPLLMADPLGRSDDSKREVAALATVKTALQTWSAASQRTIAWSDWWGTFRARCEQLLARIRDPQKALKSVGPWLDASQARLQALGIAARGVATALSHGDLQQGNILLDATRPWLIDWESVDRRVVDYDAWTLALGPRFRNQARMQALPSLALAQSAGDPAAAERRSLLFLLQELRFYLEESASGPLYAPTPGTLAFVQGLPGIGPEAQTRSAWDAWERNLVDFAGPLQARTGPL